MVKVWDLDAKSDTYCTCLLTLKATFFNTAIVTQDSTTIVIGLTRYKLESTLRLFELKSGKCLLNFDTDDAVFSLAISNDDKYLIAGSWKHARIWDVDFKSNTFGTCLLLLDGVNHDRIRFVAFSSNTQYVVTACNKKAVIWDVDPKSDTYKQPIIEFEDGHEFASVALSPDGKNIALGLRNGIVQLWSIEKYLNNRVKELYKKNSSCDFDLSFNNL